MAVVISFKALSRHFPGGCDEEYIRKLDVPTQIRTSNLKMETSEAFL
jgi:hypothetical protein